MYKWISLWSITVYVHLSLKCRIVVRALDYCVVCIFVRARVCVGIDFLYTLYKIIEIHENDEFNNIADYAVFGRSTYRT